jgi:hypothetical protein
MMRKLGILFLLVLAVRVKAATLPEIVNWIGTRDRAVNAAPIDVAITLADPHVGVPEVVQVTSGGTEINGSAVTPSIVMRSGQTFLRVVFDPATFAKAAIYAIKVRVPGIAEKFNDSIIELSITRPAADLAMQQPIRIDHIVNLLSPDDWIPGAWVVKETTGQQLVSTPGWVVTELSGPDPKSRRTRLKFGMPTQIPPAKQRDLKLIGASASFPLGTSTGKLSIDSPQLAKPFEQTVEVATRISRFWLLFTILLSIALGHWVRKVLEERRLRAEALAAAAVPLAELQRLIDATADNDFRKRYSAARRTLENAARDPKANLASATQTANDAIKSTGTELATAQAAAAARLSDMTAAIGSPDAQVGALRDTVAAIAKSLRDVETTLNAAQIAVAKKKLDRIDAVNVIEKARERWIAFVEQIAADAQQWSDAAAGNDFGAIRTAANAVQAVVNPPDIAAAIAASAKVTIDLRVATARTVATGRKLAQKVVDELGASKDDLAVAPTLQTLRAAMDALEGCGDDVALCASRVAALQSAVVAGVAAAAASAAAKHAVFDTPLGDTDAVADLAKTVHDLVTVPAAPLSSIPARIVADDAATVDSRMTLRVVIDDKVDAATVSVVWYVADRQQKEGAAGDLEFDWTPPSVTPAVVRAQLSLSDGRIGTASLTVSPVKPLDLIPDALDKAGKRVQWLQTAVSALFIIPVGYLIFAKGFIGNPEDFLAAALWGFAADVSLPKLLSLAAPIAAKTLTLP